MTNPSAEERAHKLVSPSGRDKWAYETKLQFVTEQIRQAEQAAYERAAQVADGEQAYLAETKYEGRAHSVGVVARKIRALAQEPEEVR